MPRSLSASSLGSLPIQIDATARDYASIRDELIRLAARLTPEWTDFYEADPGVVLLEAMAYVGDVLSYTTDRVTNEAYLFTAQERANVIHLLRLIGYELSPGSAASVPMVIRTSGPVTLNAGWKVASAANSTTSSVTFELRDTVPILNAGYWTTPEMAAKVSAAGYSPVFTHPGLVFISGTSVTNEILGSSSGTANQYFALANNSLALDTNGGPPMTIRVGLTDWTLVPSFLGAEYDSNVYRYQVEPGDQVLIAFGDGVNGKIPDIGQNIYATYRYGGGSYANSVGVGTVNTIVNPLASVLSVWNPVQPSGGSDIETITHAKKFGPLSLRSLDRCVTLEDFETMAMLTPGGGVKSARAAHLSGPWQVDLFVVAQGSNPVPTGTWYPSLNSGTGTIGAVGRWLSLKKPVPTELKISGPVIANPKLIGKIVCMPNVLQADVKEQVRINLVNFFRSLTEDFGIGVPLSRLIQVVENTRGVDWFQPKAFHRIPSLRFISGKKTAFDSAYIIADIKDTCQQQIYTVKCLNLNSYQLIGDTYGPIRNTNGSIKTFQFGVSETVSFTNLYPSDTVPLLVPQFSLLIDKSVSPNAHDVWQFATDNYLGNLSIGEYEMIVATILPSGDLDPNQIQLVYGGGIG